MQNAVYIGMKKNHSIKSRTIISLDENFLHAARPIEGFRHDWFNFFNRETDEMFNDKLYDIFIINGIQYYIHEDSTYNLRPYFDIPFRGASLDIEENVGNLMKYGSRVSVG